jgi:ABC-type uncharacterized transport system substrate-binding protein
MLETAWKMKKAAVSSIMIAAILLAVAVIAQAQQPKKVYRIGFLHSGSPSSVAKYRDACLQALSGLGYIEGKNISFEYRYAEGKLDRLPELATELAGLKVDVIVTGGPAALAAKNASKTTPIVITDIGDPVGVGLVASLAHPGGNVTGLSTLAKEITGKQLELLKEVLSTVSLVAVLWDPTNPSNALNLEETKVAAAALRVTLRSVEVRGPDDFDPAFSAIKTQRASALMVLRNPVTITHRTRIMEFAAKSRLPTMYADSEFTDAGGLMSYGSNRLDLWRRAATYVDKILKGSKPADLPVEQPMKFELVINLKTARQIGLTIPPNVLVRADRVIK